MQTTTAHMAVFKHSFVARALCALALSVGIGAAGAQTWGSYETPFAANSPWNSRPVNPVLGAQTIPTSDYYPTVELGKYSTGVFLATSSDPSVRVYSYEGQLGIKIADAIAYQPSIEMPHWPDNVQPAPGSDGHAEIVDTQLGIIHSFYQLKKVDGVWRATLYAWSNLNGRGWGDPSHYYQGSRATGIPASAGMIRKHEVNNGELIYRHALAMSMTYNGLDNNPTYIFPATSADWDAASANSGEIPMGSLLMLPADFDASSIKNSDLRKIAETLKVYGAYVVDRNHGTPFAIYAEIGNQMVLHPSGGWDSTLGNDFQKIRAALRPVVRVDSWLDANGGAYVRDESKFNLLSMRGKWLNISGQSVSGYFDVWQQAVVFPEPQGYPVTMLNNENSNIGIVAWGRPVSGKTYRFTAKAQGGAKIRMMMKGCAVSIDTGFLNNGQYKDIVWPMGSCKRQLIVTSGFPGPSKVAGELVEVSN